MAADQSRKQVRTIEELEREFEQCKEENKTLREREKRLSLIVQSSSIPTLVVDENHVITHCNKAYENFKGISAESMIGTRNQWRTLYTSPKPAMMDFLVDRVPEEEILKYFGHRCRRSPIVEGAYEAELFIPGIGENGEWFFFKTAPLIDETGHLVGAIETIQDVTQRKRAEEDLEKSERRFRILLDFVPYPIGVFTMDGRPTYLNPAFTKVFGWTLDELEGGKIPFVPEEAKKETIENLHHLYRDKILVRYHSRRLTKDGRVLETAIRAAVYWESGETPSGVISIFRDITQEKRAERMREAMLNISMALPRYPDLGSLLDYINDEVKRLIDTEGAVVTLLNEERKEFIILGASYDEADTKKRVKELRFPMDQLISGKVVRSGKPIIVTDTSADRSLYEARDRKMGYKTRNLAAVPWRGRERIGGTVCAVNKKQGEFDQADIELLEMLAGTVSLSIENAGVSDELKKAYEEVSALNRAKDKAINHLSHELKTPVSVLSGSLKLLLRKLELLQDQTWKSTMEMAERNLERIKEIQYEAQDIMEGGDERVYRLLSVLMDECTDQLSLLFSQAGGDDSVAEKVRKKIEEIFGPKKAVSEPIRLDEMISQRLELLRTSFAHRSVELITKLISTPPVFLPPEVLQKIIDGLIRNAIENTPDQGRIEVETQKQGEGSLLLVKDYGIGIPEEAKKRIFEGFFTIRDIKAYSTKKPYDFAAGGKGADLLRMKIFSSRYGFEINMTSTRCRFIPKESDLCPGQISKCSFCHQAEDCYNSGGTLFTVYFPPRRAEV